MSWKLSEEIIEKKDVRILWNLNNGKITDLVVTTFNIPKDYHCKVKEYQDKRYQGSMGNCSASWMQDSEMFILLSLFAVYGFENNKYMDNALNELSKIDTFRPFIQEFFKGPFGKL